MRSAAAAPNAAWPSLRNGRAAGRRSAARVGGAEVRGAARKASGGDANRARRVAQRRRRAFRRGDDRTFLKYHRAPPIRERERERVVVQIRRGRVGARDGVGTRRSGTRRSGTRRSGTGSSGTQRSVAGSSTFTLLPGKLCAHEVSQARQRARHHLVPGVHETPLDARQEERLARRAADEPSHGGDASKNAARSDHARSLRHVMSSGTRKSFESARPKNRARSSAPASSAARVDGPVTTGAMDGAADDDATDPARVDVEPAPFDPFAAPTPEPPAEPAPFDPVVDASSFEPRAAAPPSSPADVPAPARLSPPPNPPNVVVFVGSALAGGGAPSGVR